MVDYIIYAYTYVYTTRQLYVCNLFAHVSEMRFIYIFRSILLNDICQRTHFNYLKTSLTITSTIQRDPTDVHRFYSKHIKLHQSRYPKRYVFC